MSWLEFFVAIFAIACAKDSIVAVARAIERRQPKQLEVPSVDSSLSTCQSCGEFLNYNHECAP